MAQLRLVCPLGELLAPGDFDRFALFDRQRHKGWPLPAAYRMRFVGPDGSLRMADVRWERSAESRVVLTARDVTDVTRAEALLGQLARLPMGLDGADLPRRERARVPGARVDNRLHRAGRWRVNHDAGNFAPGDPVGEYGRAQLGCRMPFSDTPVVAHVVATGTPLFLDNLPRMGHATARGTVALQDCGDDPEGEMLRHWLGTVNSPNTGRPEGTLSWLQPGKLRTGR